MSPFLIRSVTTFLTAIFLLLTLTVWAGASENPVILPVIANETDVRPPVVLDDFEDLSGWRVTILTEPAKASGAIRLVPAPREMSMRSRPPRATLSRP